MQNGKMYHFEGCKGKGIELSKTITYEELLKTVCQILRVDPRESNVSMKYVSRPDSRSYPIGESEPVSGCETIYWDLLLFFFFFFRAELISVVYKRFL